MFHLDDKPKITHIAFSKTKMHQASKTHYPQNQEKESRCSNPYPTCDMETSYNQNKHASLLVCSCILFVVRTYFVYILMCFLLWSQSGYACICVRRSIVYTSVIYYKSISCSIFSECVQKIYPCFSASKCKKSTHNLHRQYTISTAADRREWAGWIKTKGQ